MHIVFTDPSSASAPTAAAATGRGKRQSTRQQQQEQQQQQQRRYAELVKLVLQYDTPGGKMQSYAIVDAHHHADEPQSQSQQQQQQREVDAVLPDAHLPLIDAAFRANDAPLLIQELWRALQVRAAA